MKMQEGLWLGEFIPAAAVGSKRLSPEVWSQKNKNNKRKMSF